MVFSRDTVPGTEDGWTTDRLTAILDAIPAAVTLWDRDLQCWFANAVAAAEGLPATGSQGAYLQGIAGADSSEDVAVAFDRALAGQTVLLDRVLSDEAGVRRHFSGILTPFRDADEVTGVSLVDVDVSPAADVSSAARLALERASRLAERQRIGARLDRRTLNHLDGVLASITEGMRVRALPQASAVLDALDDCIDDLRAAVQGKITADADLRATYPALTEATETRPPRMSPRLPSRRGWSATESLALLDQIPAIVTSWDACQCNTFSNAAALTWYDRPDRRTVTGTHMRDLLKPEYYEPEIEMVHAALAGRYQQHDRLVPDPQGRPRNLQVTHAPVIEDGTIVGSYVLILDATARIAAESAALAAREELAALHERQRISDDLHNVVIQRLFATGLAVTAAARADGASAVGHLRDARESLAQSLKELRQSLDREPYVDDVVSSVTGLVQERTRRSGLRASVQLIGPVNDVRPQVASDLLAALSAALASASTGRPRINVTISADDEMVHLRVAEAAAQPDESMSARTLTRWSSPC